MKTKLLIFLLLCGLVSKAQTIEVSGLQSGTWNADTVLIKDNVYIQDSLRILAGTTVLFEGFYQISVEEGASLTALGTVTDTILFTVADTTGFHFFNFGRGGWNGIRMDKAGDCRFDYCRFQNGKAALDDDQDGGALRIFGCDNVEIGHSKLFCNFSREHGGALNAENSNVVMHDCDVSNNLLRSEIDTIYFMYGAGLRFLKCEVDIATTKLQHNYGETSIGGAMSIDSCSVRIDRCRFEHNVGINGGGLYMIRCYDNPCSITNSLFANNTSGHFGGGLAVCEASPWISNLTVVNNHSIGVNCGGIFFYQYSEPILWNCIVYGNTNEIPLDEPVQIWSWTYDESGPQFYGCLIQYGLENISNNEVVTVYEGCLDEDPLFVDPENEDFHLTANSPCINAGYTMAPDMGCDLDGNWRVCGERIDIGAYEYTATGTEEMTQNDQFIRVVGNPITASSYAEINIETPCRATAKIISMEGKILFNNDLWITQKGFNRIGIGEMFDLLSQGTYLLVIKTKDKVSVSIVVK